MSETFTDADTILASPDFDIGALIEAETLTVRVCPYQDLIEVDTFRLGGLADALSEADCNAPG